MDSMSMPGTVWEEIHGFATPGEYVRFVQYIEKQVKDGHAEEIVPDPDYGYGKIFGGRWFKDVQTSKTWRLVPPDIPFKGLWEPVKR